MCFSSYKNVCRWSRITDSTARLHTFGSLCLHLSRFFFSSEILFLRPFFPHFCKQAGAAIPLLRAWIIVAASQTLYCEAWKAFGESGNSCSSLNCPEKWRLAFCCISCLSCKLSSAWRVSEWGTQRWCKMLYKPCLMEKCKTRKEWTFLSFSDPL